MKEVYIGKVKDNVDPQCMGRLKVYIPDFNNPESDPNSWITVDYCSPFGGVTPASALGNDITAFAQTQTSYGMWFVPPDLENQVAVFFINGEKHRGYWFGCVYSPGMNHMVPGVAASTAHTDMTTADPLPVGEYNKLSPKSSRSFAKPVSPMAVSLVKQGLIKDKIRGLSPASARRNIRPAEVYGILTPGPLDPSSPGGKGRLGGHQFYMDDSPTNECIVMRTRSGAQVRLDETNGLVYIINRDGTAWLQMDADGNVDVFGAKNISMRSVSDINLKADKNVNIEGQNINFKAMSVMSFDSVTTNMNTNNLYLKSSESFNLSSIKINTNSTIMNLKTTDFNMASTYTGITSSEINLLSDSNIAITGNHVHLTASDVNIGSSTVGIISKVDVSGAFSVTGLISQNASTPTPAAAIPATVKSPEDTVVPSKLKVASKIDVVDVFSNGNTRDRTTISTIASRLPTFEPCPEHKQSGS